MRPLESHEPGLRRLLFGIDNRPCPYGCTYCFARFGLYKKTTTLADVEASPSLLNGIDVVYPACDSDLFARRDFADVMSRTALLARSVSISTKAPLTAEHIASASAAKLKLRGAGVIKIGVSISTKYSIGQIEPRASEYSIRIRNLQRLRAAGIYNCIVLRPLLADVSQAEYEEILLDVVGLTDRVLLGDEWLDEPARPSADSTPLAEKRLERVNWLPGQPTWSKRVDATLHNGVARIAEQLGFRTFESDLELMKDVLAEEAEVRRSWTG